MTAKYLRCDNCGEDFPPYVSDFKDSESLRLAAQYMGWVSKGPASAYTLKDYCAQCIRKDQSLAKT